MNSLIQTTVVFEVLDNILSESNQASYDSLQEVGVASQAVVMNAESFGLFTAQALPSNEDKGPGQVVNITGENMGVFINLYFHLSSFATKNPSIILSKPLPALAIVLINSSIVITQSSYYYNPSS